MLIRAVVALIVFPLSLALGQSQHAMNERAARHAHRADSTMNAVYRRLEAKVRSDSVALRKLRAAQRAWVAFRDAELDSTYPAADRLKAYGSVNPMCVSIILEQLTRARTSQLEEALHPQEGDVCAGGPG